MRTADSGNENGMSPTRGNSGGWHVRTTSPGSTAAAPRNAVVYAVDRTALAGLRNAVTRRARDCGLDEDARDDLVLIANELATNVIRHGGGIGEMALWHEDHWLVCRISDHGPGMADPERAGVVTSAPDAVTGRGLWLVRRLGHEVEVASGPWGTTVTVAMALPVGVGSRSR